MKLIKPSYEILTPINGEEILKEIELAARTCYKSEGKIEYEDADLGTCFDSEFHAKSARILIPKLIARGHEAMLEFGGMITVKFICDRGVSHELVRHRLASFAQESTRYCNYGKDEHITFIIPKWHNIEEGVYVNGDFKNDKINNIIKDKAKYRTWIWFNLLIDSEISYNGLISHGESPQQARSVLPNSLKTEVNVSANIREWRHIFKLRTAKAAHPQMRELMIPLLAEFKEKIPIIFDDINVEE